MAKLSRRVTGEFPTGVLPKEVEDVMREILDTFNAGEPVTQEMLDRLPPDGEVSLPITVTDKDGTQHHGALVFTKGNVRVVESTH